MNRAEVTELFAILMLAYPNAETFKAPTQQALMEKLAPTITLWAACLKDVDARTGQEAIVKLCQTCKFPPTIAELREAVKTVRSETEGEIMGAFREARNALNTAAMAGLTAEQVLARLPKRTQRVIAEMGGLDAFAPPDKSIYDVGGFRRTYEGLLRTNPVGLPGGTTLPALAE